MNLVNREYHKRARILLENWEESQGSSKQFALPEDAELPGFVSLNLLTADASISDVNKLCRMATDYALGRVVVNPSHVQRCVQILGQDVATGTVVGFPLGANHQDIKVAETQLAVDQGASRISLVINLGLLKTSNFQEVFEELRAVRHTCPETDLSVILETALLDPLQIIIGSMLCREAGADGILTATGFRETAVPTESISLLRFVLGNDLDIHASAGIKNRESMLDALRAGATRISVDFSDFSAALFNFTEGGAGA